MLVSSQYAWINLNKFWRRNNHFRKTSFRPVNKIIVQLLVHLMVSDKMQFPKGLSFAKFKLLCDQ